MNNIDNLLSSITQTQSATFCSLLYKAKTTNEKARLTINLNVDIEKLYVQDIELLKNLRESIVDPIEIEACDELIESFTHTLSVGLGNNVNYTQKNVQYKRFIDKDGNVIKNVKQHPNGQLHLSGLLINKEVIEPGEYKERNSRPKTIAKDKLRKQLRTSKFRNYVVDTNSYKVKVWGNTIEFNEDVQ
jgi:hypothetical protein